LSAPSRGARRGTNDLADVFSSASAMACCAQMDYRCAGVTPPDDCCKRMGHDASRPAPSTAASTHDRGTKAPIAIVPPPSITRSLESDRAFVSAAFARPHDPPHLHAFSLLI